MRLCTNFLATLAGICIATTALALPASAQAQAAAPSTSAIKPLLSSAQPLWLDLSSQQQQFLKSLEKQWYTLSTTERKSWMSLADRVPKMSPEEQTKALTRVNEWAALTPEQRKLARANYRLAKDLPQQERSAQWQQYQSMTPAQQSVLRNAGWTSNTAAQHAGAKTGLAKEASQPIKDIKAKAIKAPAPSVAEAPKK